MHQTYNSLISSSSRCYIPFLCVHFQISSHFGEQFYLQADTFQMMNDWYASLQATIKRIVSTQTFTILYIHMHDWYKN